MPDACVVHVTSAITLRPSPPRSGIREQVLRRRRHYVQLCRSARAAAPLSVSPLSTRMPNSFIVSSVCVCRSHWRRMAPFFMRLVRMSCACEMSLAYSTSASLVHHGCIWLRCVHLEVYGHPVTYDRRQPPVVDQRLIEQIDAHGQGRRTLEGAPPPGMTPAVQVGWGRPFHQSSLHWLAGSYDAWRCHRQVRARRAPRRHHELPRCRECRPPTQSGLARMPASAVISSAW